MVSLVKSTQAWNSGDFESVLKSEVKALGLDHLPLQKGLSSSSIALDDNLDLTVLRVHESNNLITIKLGVFYSGIIAGCSCSDDPTPTDIVNEYCDINVTINLTNAQASIALLEDND